MCHEYYMEYSQKSKSFFKKSIPMARWCEKNLNMY